MLVVGALKQAATIDHPVIRLVTNALLPLINQTKYTVRWLLFPDFSTITSSGIVPHAPLFEVLCRNTNLCRLLHPLFTFNTRHVSILDIEAVQ